MRLVDTRGVEPDAAGPEGATTLVNSFEGLDMMGVDVDVVWGY
jgi:hypothetical protein